MTRCVPPNDVSLVNILPACASLGASLHGKQAHVFVVRIGLVDNVFVGNTLVDMYAKCGLYLKVGDIAGAGFLVYMNFPNYTRQSSYQKKESSSVMGPLLSSSVFEPYVTSLVQDMFLVAQNFDN
ncbi:hypothetical protein SESBI_25051 [Sesbania bispinosa]|nr:hypothetical protein SESBI_25051 [Sesbania bispinosa]